jgi:hypothetical protein
MSLPPVYSPLPWTNRSFLAPHTSVTTVFTCLFKHHIFMDLNHESFKDKDEYRAWHIVDKYIFIV